MLNKKVQTQSVEGDNNQTAGGDIVNIYPSAKPTEHTLSALEKILLEISSLDIAEFSPEHFTPFNLMDKIDLNEIIDFKLNYDDYTEDARLIKHKTTLLESTDSTIDKKITRYIRSIYQQQISQSISADAIISAMQTQIKNELLKVNQECNLDDTAYIRSVIFYVFAKCKIFKAPPKI